MVMGLLLFLSDFLSSRRWTNSGEVKTYPSFLLVVDVHGNVSNRIQHGNDSSIESSKHGEVLLLLVNRWPSSTTLLLWWLLLTLLLLLMRCWHADEVVVVYPIYIYKSSSKVSFSISKSMVVMLLVSRASCVAGCSKVVVAKFGPKNSNNRNSARKQPRIAV